MTFLQSQIEKCKAQQENAKITIRRQDTGKNMLIRHETLSALMRSAQDLYPDEGCGLLIGDADRFLVTEFMNLENTVHPDMAGKHFALDPLKVYEAEQKVAKEELDILGFFHTHPDHEAILSEEDCVYMIPGMVYMILSVAKGRYRDIRVFEKRQSGSIVTEILMLPV